MLKVKLLWVVSLLWLSACSHHTSSFPVVPLTDSKRLSLAQAHLLLGQWSLAKDQLEGISSAAHGREYWRLLSLYWLSVENLEQALKVSKLGLSYYPNDGFLLNNYGVILGTKKEWEKACSLFQQANDFSFPKRQSVQINLSRCALRQEDVKLAEKHLDQAKEIAELPVIGLLTELNLVLIQGNNDKARIIFNNIQTFENVALGWAHFDEFKCLSKYIHRHVDDAAKYSYASDFTCLNGSRY